MIDPIAHLAEQAPTQCALISSDKQWTYSELHNTIHAIYLDLKQRGVLPGERVAFLAESKWQSIALLFALFRLQAIACPLSTKLPQEQIAISLQRLGCQELLALDTLPTTSCPAPSCEVYPNAPALFLFTSGTLKNPKIAVLTVNNFFFSAVGSLDILKLQHSSRCLLSLPLYHVSGLSILFRSFFAGATVCLSDQPMAEAIKNLKITHLSVVPTQLFRLLQEPQDALQTIAMQLQAILVGGAPLSAHLCATALQQGLKIMPTYGMTETSSQVAINPNPTPTSCDQGIVLPYREVKIAETKEVLVRGKTLFKGYFDKESGTGLPCNAEGWFATGDLGELHADTLCIIGRKDNLFISGGENVQPEEIEAHLLTFPGVIQAVVIATLDEEFGALPVAFVQMEQEIVQQEIQDYLKHKLPSYKIPKKILPLPPHTGLKPSRAALRNS